MDPPYTAFISKHVTVPRRLYYEILILRYHTNNLLVRHLYMLYVNELLYNSKIDHKYITREQKSHKSFLLSFIRAVKNSTRMRVSYTLL